MLDVTSTSYKGPLYKSVFARLQTLSELRPPQFRIISPHKLVPRSRFSFTSIFIRSVNFSLFFRSLPHYGIGSAVSIPPFLSWILVRPSFLRIISPSLANICGFHHVWPLISMNVMFLIPLWNRNLLSFYHSRLIYRFRWVKKF